MVEKIVSIVRALPTISADPADYKNRGSIYNSESYRILCKFHMKSKAAWKPVFTLISLHAAKAVLLASGNRISSPVHLRQPCTLGK